MNLSRYGHPILAQKKGIFPLPSPYAIILRVLNIPKPHS